MKKAFVIFVCILILITFLLIVIRTGADGQVIPPPFNITQTPTPVPGYTPPPTPVPGVWGYLTYVPFLRN